MNTKHNDHFSRQPTRHALCERARALISHDLVFLLSTTKVPARVLDLARSSWKDELDVPSRLIALSEAIWVTATESFAPPCPEAKMRTALLMRAAALVNLLRVHVEERNAGALRAEQALALVGGIAWTELPEISNQSETTGSPDRAQISLGWQRYVRSLAERMRSRR